MRRFKDHNELALLHNLAILYLGLAAEADGELDPAELREANARLRRWQPDKDPACIDHVMRDVALSYREETAGESLHEILNDLGRYLAKDRRVEILYDLAGMARADSTLLDVEQDYIQRIARAWRLDDECSAGAQAHLFA